MENEIGFSSIQVSNLLTVIESYGLFLDVDDSTASSMFSELLITMINELNPDQVKSILESV